MAKKQTAVASNKSPGLIAAFPHIKVVIFEWFDDGKASFTKSELDEVVRSRHGSEFAKLTAAAINIMIDENIVRRSDGDASKKDHFTIDGSIWEQMESARSDRPRPQTSKLIEPNGVLRLVRPFEAAIDWDNLRSEFGVLCSVIAHASRSHEWLVDDSLGSSIEHFWTSVSAVVNMADNCRKIHEPLRGMLCYGSRVAVEGPRGQHASAATWCEFALDLSITFETLLATRENGLGNDRDDVLFREYLEVESCILSQLESRIEVELRQAESMAVKRRLNEDDWTGWTITKIAKTWFPDVTSSTGWTNFANKLRRDGLMENHPVSGAIKVRIRRSVFTTHGLPFPPEVSQS